jgi:uncharacterized protein (TIGR02996 family)
VSVVDQWLEHIPAAVHEAWSGAVSQELLDSLWGRGRQDEVYRLVASFARRRAETLACYSALDRERARSARAAREALACAGPGPAGILLTLPLSDPAVREAAGVAGSHMGYRSLNAIRVRDPEVGLPSPAQLEEAAIDEPAVLAWAAARAPAAEREAALEQAWSKYFGNGSLHAMLVATRSVGLWHLIPVEHRAAAVRFAALEGDLSRVDQILDGPKEKTGPATRGLCLAGAALALPQVPPAWRSEILANAATADQDYEEGLLAWGVAACEGPAALDARITSQLESARATAESFVASLGKAPAVVAASETVRKRALERLEKGLKEKPFRMWRVSREVARAGRAGRLELARELVDRAEKELGPLLAVDASSAAEALVYYPGRAQGCAQALDEYSSSSLRLSVAAALARDGDLETARAQASIALEQPAGTLSASEIEEIAPFVFQLEPGLGSRLREFIVPELRQLPGGTAAPQAALAARKSFRSAEFEQMLAESPEDQATALVYADLLQAQGDPRGELIALHHAGKRAEARALIERNREHFLGPLADYLHPLDGDPRPAFEWRLGFIRSAVLGYCSHRSRQVSAKDGLSLEAALEALLTHPSGALLQELLVTTNMLDDGMYFGPVTDALARHGAPALRRLRLGEYSHAGARSPRSDYDYEISWTRFADMSATWPRLPRLESFTIQGCLEKPVLGEIRLPSLRELVLISGGTAAENTRAIAAADWPCLETLEIWFGKKDYGFSGGLSDLAPILEGKRLPRLRRLRLMNASFADELAEAISRAPILPRLSELSFALGTLTDAGVRALAANGRALSHLASLDLEANYLTDEGVALAGALCAEVLVDDQKDAAEDGGDRYVSVGE